ncbi:MAG TPA: condensation domain-containing protein [Streptosporangiaceae bacterium]|nr:condensation domain-containing protein [Streptosporangiaceae bacterium]
MSVSETPRPAGALTADPAARIALSSNLDLFCLFDKGDGDGAFGPRHLVILGWRLTGQLDLDALQGALDDVVIRHEMLRTTVVRGDADPYQKVRPPTPARLEVIDLPEDDARPRDERVDDFVNEIEATTLSADELPHLRAVVGRLDERDSVLVLVTHHIASDGWSLHVIISDLAIFYAARRGFGTPRLPPMRQYQDYAVWQKGVLASAASDASRGYWRQKLRGAEMLDIRADRRMSPEAIAVYSVHRFLIDQELTSATLNFARAMRSSPFMVLLSAFNALLHQMTGATDLVSATITSGRVDPSFNETVGPFFNLLPLRTDLSGCRNFIELVRRIRETCLEAYAHELPYGEIVAQAPELTRTYERDDGAVCAFQLLQYPGMTEPETVGDLRYAEVRERTKSSPRTSDIPNGVLWGLDILPSGEIGGTMRFNSQQFDEATMVRMVDDFRGVLRRSLADPSSPLPAL